MIKVGLVGGNGYAGSELLRLLALHPEVEISAVTSRSDAGKAVADVFPTLRNQIPAILFTQPTVENLKHCDVVFFATPHGVCMNQARALLDANIRIIDLGADFRLKNLDNYEKWYHLPHSEPEINKEAVYGLVEVNREQLKQARIIGLPGCYPTAVQLGLLPLLKGNALIDENHIIASCASGVSGAGRTPNVPILLAEAGENFKAYATPGHRHLPEIEQGIQAVTNRPCQVTFTPHLVPMVRGILATLFIRLNDAGQKANLQSIYELFYADEFFVDVMPFGSQPETKLVRGSNFAKIAIHQPQNRDTTVILCVIDNLVKGAAGQAVQALNVCYGLPENLGLTQLPLCP